MQQEAVTVLISYEEKVSNNEKQKLAELKGETFNLKFEHQ